MPPADIQPVPAAKLSSYRPDIDGLRAVAVASVVLFHAFPDLVEGGFVGVDVFFVISGFLITSIILRGLAAGSFEFADFYSRRIRRIFPSLIVVLTACYGLGWFLLFNWEFRQLGWDIVGGAGFASNLLLWGEAGYFDRAAETKPLLHLWSLGIEEQFYLLFPLVFWVVNRQRRSQALAIGVLLVSSFAINIAIHKSLPVADFYSPASRFWELLCGSLLAALTAGAGSGMLFKGRVLANSASGFGFCALAAALVLGNKGIPFPGWFAVLPVVGATAIIAAGPVALPNAWFLSTAPMRWLGSISYPLYLWHWPLLVFARVARSGIPPAMTRAWLMLAAVGLAWLTCVLVENRLRFGGHNRRKILVLVGTLGVMAVLGGLTRKLNGVPSRAFTALNVDLTFRNAATIENTAFGCGIEDVELAKRFDRCQHDTREKPSVALLGDSKARALSLGLFRHSDPHSRVLFIGGTREEVVPLPAVSDDPIYAPFQPWTKVALEAVSKNADIKLVILTMSTRGLYALKDDRSIETLPKTPHQKSVIEAVDRVVKALAAVGKKVILTVDNPTLPPPEDCIVRRSSSQSLNWLFPPKAETCSVSYDRQLELSALYRAALAEIERRNAGVVAIFDTLPVLCDMDARVCRTMENGRLYYAYTDHISDLAAEMIGEQLMPFARRFAGLDASVP